MATMSMKKSSGDDDAVPAYWFRPSDLRLDDNLPLLSACRSAASKEGMVPLYIFDSDVVGQTSDLSSNRRMGIRRANFLLECVADLRRSLERRGSGLFVAAGGPSADVFRQMTSRTRRSLRVYCQMEVASEERRALRSARAALAEVPGGRLEEIWGGTMYDVADLPYGTNASGGNARAANRSSLEGYRGIVEGMPDSFTPFRNKVEKKCSIPAPRDPPGRKELAINDSFRDFALSNDDENKINSGILGSFSYLPTLEDLGFSTEEIEEWKEAERANQAWEEAKRPLRFTGGETAGLERVKNYIWEKDLLRIYFETRNGMLGADYSTKFSPWLAYGCVSPRRIAAECATYEERREKNKSTYWVVFELLWRDFFKFFALKHGNDIFMLDGTLGERARGEHPNSRRWGFDPKKFAAWAEGRTG